MTASTPQIVGRYALHEEIAAGGMARVHLARLSGPGGFSRTVAIKRLHSHVARDPEFVTMFLDEARIAARIRHPNVVSTLDVVATEEELFLVMEYITGEALSRLERAAFRQGPIAPEIVVSILCGALRGVHAAHEARDERGEPLDIVHRDLTPHNILVGTDGVARVLDFGVAKATGKAHATRTGEMKGKIPYMSPEQIRGSVTRRTDIYAAAVVTWEALTGKRLFKGDSEVEIMAKVLDAKVPPPSSEAPSLPRSLDEVVLRGLAIDPDSRFATAEEMAAALERCVAPAPHRLVGQWVESLAGNVLSQRAELVAHIESSSPRDKGIESFAFLGPPSSQSPPSAADGERSGRTAPAVHVPAEEAPQSVSTQRSQAEARRGGRLGAIAGIAIAMAAVLAIGVVLGRRSSEGSSGAGVAPADSGSQAAPLPAPSVVPAPPPALTAAPSAEESAAPASGAAPSVSGAPAESSAPVTSPSRSAAPSGKPPASPPPRGTAAPAKPPKASCNPPYTVDAQGVKHYKVECL